jgi:acyl dehydratase
MTKLYYFEDVEPGTVEVSWGRTVTEADIVNFSGVSGDFNPLHVDEEWARKNTPFGGRIAQGMLVTSISYALHSEMLAALSVVGWMEASRRFLHPVMPGDTIHTVWTVREKRLSASRPGMGIVTLDLEVRNQDDVVVQDGFDVVMINARATDGPS